MTAPHDAPSAAELVEAVREWLQGDVLAGTSGRLQFHARVAANVLAMVERELRAGADQQAAHEARLASLGMSDDAALAAAVRDGRVDYRDESVRAAVRASVEDKLRVANPGYLAPPG